MWNAGHNYNHAELEVVKELERELFKYNPGFRSMWHDDFEAYFRGTMNQERWERRERERSKELAEIQRKRMLEDFEYVRFRHELAVLEEQLFGDSNFSMKYNEWQKDWSQRREKWETDKLYQTAKDWGWELSKAAFQLYEKYKIIHLFRIGINASYVPAKIVFASSDTPFEEPINSLEDLSWNTSWIGYTLSATFANRSLESLLELKQGKSNINLNLEKFLRIGLGIRKELIDRLEKLHQLGLSRL